MPDIHLCEIIDNTQLTEAIFSITVISSKLSGESAPGQFLHVKCGEKRVLRRPISICSVRGDQVQFIFEVKGEGTKWLSRRIKGTKLNILGPLGNGFELPDDKFIIVGGGLGSPPMLFAAQAAKTKPAAILGFREKNRIILTCEFKAACDEVYITTEDGSSGIHGFVTDPLEKLIKKGGYKAVLSCGQMAMQKAVAEICAGCGIPCQVSLEERMGCGIGACLVCACETKKDGIIQMSRACKDGPVFDADKVVWKA